MYNFMMFPVNSFISAVLHQLASINQKSRNKISIQHNRKVPELNDRTPNGLLYYMVCVQ